MHRLSELLTMSSVRSRFVKRALSQNPNAVFLYLGTEGRDSREFCSTLTNAANSNKIALSSDEIISVTPDRPGDAIFNGGGWGCKHLWIPVFPLATGSLED